MSDERTNLLDAELTRGKTPGLRVFSVGLWILAVQLGLEKDEAHSWSILAWLMDERNPLEVIRNAPAMADFAKVIADYEWNIVPAFLDLVKAEVKRSKAAINALDFVVEPKPDEKPKAVPEKKS